MHNCPGKFAHKTEMELMGINVSKLVKITVATVSINLNVSCNFGMFTDWLALLLTDAC